MSHLFCLTKGRRPFNNCSWYNLHSVTRDGTHVPTLSTVWVTKVTIIVYDGTYPKFKMSLVQVPIFCYRLVGVPFPEAKIPLPITKVIDCFNYLSL